MGVRVSSTGREGGGARSRKPAAIPSADCTPGQAGAAEERALALREMRARLEVQRNSLFEQRAILESRRSALRKLVASLSELQGQTRALAETARLSREALRASLQLPDVPVRSPRADRAADPRPTPAGVDGAGADAERAARRARPTPLPGEALRRSEQKVVDALAWLGVLGLAPARDAAVACLAGYRPRSAGWLRLRRALCRRGLVLQIGGTAHLALTPAGCRHASPLDPPSTAEELHALAAARLDAPERRVLRALLGAYPVALDLADVARYSGYHRDDDAFTGARNRLVEIALVAWAPCGGLVANQALLRFGRSAARASHARDGRDGPSSKHARPRLVRGGLRFAPGSDPGRAS